jgi:hypothetical protein
MARLPALAALCLTSAAAAAEAGVVHWTQYVSDAADCSAAHPDGGEANKTFPIGECVRAESTASSPSPGYWRVHCDFSSVTVDAFYASSDCTGPRTAPAEAMRGMLDQVLCDSSGMTVWQMEQMGGNFTFGYPRKATAETGCDFVLDMTMPGQPRVVDYMSVRGLHCPTPTLAPPETPATPEPTRRTCQFLCDDTLKALCGAAKASSSGDCFVCVGQHQRHVEKAGCTPADFDHFCARVRPLEPPLPSPVAELRAGQLVLQKAIVPSRHGIDDDDGLLVSL